MPLETVKKRILVVDDEDGCRALIRSCLEARGFEVFQATNGQEALNVVNEKAPDLIIMDKLMPRMDGMKASALLKLDVRFSEIPIIMLTVSADKALQKMSAQVGIDIFLNKPVDTTILIEKVQELLSPRSK